MPPFSPFSRNQYHHHSNNNSNETLEMTGVHRPDGFIGGAAVDDTDDSDHYHDEDTGYEVEYGDEPGGLLQNRCCRKRRWQFCVIVISLIIVGVAMLVRFSSQHHWKKNLAIQDDCDYDGNDIQSAQDSNDENISGDYSLGGTSSPGTTTPSSTTTSATANSDGIHWFELKTGNDRIDNAYKLAWREFHENIRDTVIDVNNGTKRKVEPYLIAGSGWDTLWTRDTAYAIELAAGLIHPDASIRSLMNCTEMVKFKLNANEKQRVWYQDECSHFGGWPNLSDAIVGARGAWHLYLYTGNTTFLEWAYETTVNSLKRAEQDVKHHGMFHGCSSFMESNSAYPMKYKLNGTLVGKTKALSTNMLYYIGYQVAYNMGTILMDNSDVVGHFKNQADKLKTQIRNRLWMEENGYYSYFEDEDGNLVRQMEGLGEALVLLSEDFEDSAHRIGSIMDRTYRTEVGLPCLWPRFDHGNVTISDNKISERYHNGRIWPFVSGYFAIGAAQRGRIDIFAEEMLRLIDLSEQNGTFAEFYELDKTFPYKRRRQLWSDAAYLGMVYQGIFGMVFHSQGVVFAPSKPNPQDFLEMPESISLLNVQYRKAILDIHVSGFGNRLESFKLNGHVQARPIVDATATGKQVIEIMVTQS